MTFPNVNSKVIYRNIVSDFVPRVQELYPLFNWCNIWKNLSFKLIDSYQRSNMLKFLYETLPTKER